MSINILPGTPDTLQKMKGQQFVPHDGEGVLYVKFVMVKPSTIENGDPEALINDAPGVILCGQLAEMKEQINKWFDEAAEEYSK
jgi:hypothetical protein